MWWRTGNAAPDFQKNLLNKEGKLPWRMEEHFYRVQQRLVGLRGSDSKSEGVTVTGGRGFLWTENNL